MFYDSILPEPLPASRPLSGAAKLHLSEGQPGCLLGGQQITFLEDSQAVLGQPIGIIGGQQVCFSERQQGAFTAGQQGAISEGQ
eukprot:scaffold257449_cov18-Tisochrysis_lutea.AAC.1